MITVQVQFLLECYRLEVCEGRTNNHNLLRTLQSLAQYKATTDELWEERFGE